MKQNKIPRNEYIVKPKGKTDPYKDDVQYTNLGQWKYPGQVTKIPSNDITMQGVNYPVYGEDDLGYGQMMYPGMDYTFPGQYVTETPMAQKGKQVEDNDSWLENIAEVFDPTGLSSWDDVYRAYQNTGLSGETALEVFGAIPLLGKIGKSGKIITGGFGLLQDAVKASKYLPASKQQKFIDQAYKMYQNYNKAGGKELDETLGATTKVLRDKIPYINPSKWSSSDKAINITNKSFKAGRLSDAVQAALGAKDNSGFTWDIRHGEVPKYDGRNIFPQIELGEHGDFAYGGELPKAQKGLVKSIPSESTKVSFNKPNLTSDKLNQIYVGNKIHYANDFLNKWHHSPRYQEMIKKSIEGEDLNGDYLYQNPNILYDPYTNSRVNNLQNSRIKVYPNDDNPDDASVGYADGKDIVIFKKGLQSKGTIVHELSHATDAEYKYNQKPFPYNGLKEVRGIPKKDIELMKKYASISHNPKHKDFDEYIADPSETRARLNAIRQEAYKNKLYNPFNEKVTPEIFNKLNKHNFSEEGQENLDPFLQLKRIYTDEQILDLLNSVSKTKDTKSQDVAKYGGWLDEYQVGGGYHPEYYDNRLASGEKYPIVYKDNRKIPQSGVVVDKRTNIAYAVGDNGKTLSFNVMTGANPDLNVNPYTVEQLAQNRKLRGTPVGYYNLEKQLTPVKGDDEDVNYKSKIRYLNPIPAYGQAAPSAANLAFHRLYADDAYNADDVEYNKRLELLRQADPKLRCGSYGCVNVGDNSYDKINKMFPNPDTLMVIDSKRPKDLKLLNQAKKRMKKEEGGEWLDDYEDEFKKGGQKGLKRFTSKNIQTSINDIMLRNETIYGPSGKRRYKPNLKYQDGGESTNWLDDI